MLYEMFEKGRIDIREPLTEKEILQLRNYTDLKVIQFYENLDPGIFTLLNDLVFSTRNDIALRAFGFYFADLTCDLSFLKLLPNLTHLQIDCCHHVKNLEALATLPGLKRLKLGVLNLDSFEILNDIPDTLEALCLGETRSRKPDLVCLERFSELRELFIEKQTRHIEVISSLTNLEKLSLSRISTTNVEFLQPLQKIWHLAVILGGISDFSALKGMPNIKQLELIQIRGLEDISFVSSLTGLQYLLLQNLLHVESLPPFDRLHKLKTLVLQNMKGLKDISSLASALVLEEFRQSSVLHLDPYDYLPLLSNPSVKTVAVGFSSKHKHDVFQKLAKEYGKN